MSPDTTPELYWLAATATFTALLWLPYILSFILQIGVVPAVEGRKYAASLEAGWADRAKRAHGNAVENLVVFGALAIVVHILDAGTALTAAAAHAYFFTRVAHYFIYLFGIPFLRVVSFAVGVVCQLILAATLFGLV
ncbi:MAG: MAPEG family protein [Pseudomonadota bacterium]